MVKRSSSLKAVNKKKGREPAKVKVSKSLPLSKKLQKPKLTPKAGPPSGEGRKKAGTKTPAAAKAQTPAKAQTAAKAQTKVSKPAVVDSKLERQVERKIIRKKVEKKSETRAPLKSTAKPVHVEKPRPKPFAAAVHAYEIGIKLMYAEHWEKAVKAFHELIAAYPDETEIQASAKARIDACEKKLHDRARTVVRGADDHYNIGIADMNRGELSSAVSHFQHGLKLSPKSEYILYAMAAANALLGNKDEALVYLKQSIHSRPENRFQAARDTDFAVMMEEPAFKELLSPSEK